MHGSLRRVVSFSWNSSFFSTCCRCCCCWQFHWAQLRRWHSCSDRSWRNKFCSTYTCPKLRRPFVKRYLEPTFHGLRSMRFLHNNITWQCDECDISFFHQIYNFSKEILLNFGIITYYIVFFFFNTYEYWLLPKTSKTTRQRNYRNRCPKPFVRCCTKLENLLHRSTYHINYYH